MDTKFVILLVISALLIAAIYSSSSTLKVFGNIVKNIGCSPTDGGKKVTCCGGEYDSKGNHVGYWCTTCDNTNPPSNCTDRYKGLVVVNPGKVITDVLQGGVSEDPTTGQQLDRDVGPRGEFRELPENNMTYSRANITAPTSDGQTNEDGSGYNQSTALQGYKTNLPPGISCGGTCH